MRLSLAATTTALVLLLSPMGSAPAQAGIVKSVGNSIGKRAAHKHYKLYVAKRHQRYHVAHVFKTAKEAHKAAHRYHKRGYKTKIRTI